MSRRRQIAPAQAQARLAKLEPGSAAAVPDVMRAVTRAVLAEIYERKRCPFCGRPVGKGSFNHLRACLGMPSDYDYAQRAKT